jgi:cellulose synthase/poly-beta-1,6-N-acetylglucosamine synthase-like glycosyltransferase
VYLIEFVLLAFVANTAMQLRNMVRTRAFLARNTSPPQVERPLRRIALLVPILHEGAILRDTLDTFAKLQSDAIEVCYITTEKEGGTTDNASYRALQSYQPRYFSVLHCPDPDGTKADQLNYAISQILERRDIGDTDLYFAVFDADSRPDPRGLAYVLNDDETPGLYQMYSLYTSNVERHGPFHQACALFQSRWSIAFELPVSLRNYQAGQVKALAYLIGHGLFVNFNVFGRFAFPTRSIAEDIALGYRLSFQGYTIKPVPFFDHCGVPETVWGNIAQSSRWFIGELSLFREYARSLSWENALRSTGLLARRVYQLAIWLLGAPIVALAASVSIVTGRYYLLGAIALVGLVYVVAFPRRIVDLFPTKRWRVLLYGGILIRSLLSFAGPWWGVLRLAWSVASQKPVQFNKTAR